MLGWIGATLFALCGAPQAWHCYRNGNAHGLSVSFLLMWTVGEILTMVAVIQDAPLGYLLFNYVANLVFLGIIWYYKLFNRRT